MAIIYTGVMANVRPTLLYCTLVVLSTALQNVHSFMDMEELKSVYYGLDILSEPVVVSKQVPIGAVHVTSKYGQQYQCTFPDHTTEEKKKEEEEKIAVETGIVEMLRPIGLKDCLFKSKDWWSYEFCYGKYIRQFHMEDGEIKGNIIYLGYYESDFDWNNKTITDERLKSKATLHRYHSQTYSMGTKCDLTNQMRRAEVRFICEENSEDYLARVDESETCVYTVTVMTSRICRHPYLKAPTKRKPVPITCNPLLSEGEFQDYLFEKEELKRKEEKHFAEARAAILKEDPAVDPANIMTETLQNAMSDAAKEIIAFSTDELFKDEHKEPMTQEEFQKQFGTDEDLWKMYLRGLEIAKLQQEMKMKKLEKEGDKQPDEDDEIISEFDKEIAAIKAKFQSSQMKLSNIKKKLTGDRQWEKEIENAIREAEEELGVKVDRSLISGLSDTIDKLVSKIQDTEEGLTTMDENIGKIQKGSKTVTVSKVLKKVETAEEAALDDNGDGVVEVEVEAEESVVGDENVETGDEEAQQHKMPPAIPEKDGDLEGKILAPPMEGTKGQKDPQQASGLTMERPPKMTKARPPEMTGDRPPEMDDRLKFKSEDNLEGSTDLAEKAEIKITINRAEDDVKLPKNVQKLLEESVKMELQKQQQQNGDLKTLGFDTDHSFTKDKTVHVIQQEDEDGKTNRFIFVFGFNTFNDETAENARQSSLEENYGFVYKSKKNKQPNS
ncbi:protein OS-9-like [Physella acuta]|uniref:protein OS-9-like n=1 Tax=Physella acuta TaxID=109671 RepID=UPI0027DD79F4|nr:protein OS-9-like [Physella acuta]